LSQDRYVIYDVQAKEVVKTLYNIKKDKGRKPFPQMIAISQDDKFTIEVVNDTVVQMRNLVTNTVIAKFEGHS